MPVSALTVAVTNPYPGASTFSHPAGGTWTAAVRSFLVVANYNNSGYDHDGMGWNTGTVAGWNNQNISANDQVIIEITAANPIPISYEVYYQAGASYNLAAAGTHAGTFAGSATTLTIAAPDDSRTDTFTATPTSITLDPAWRTGSPRPNVTRGFDGKLSQISYRTQRINNSITIKLTGLSCDGSVYRTLQKISAMPCRCTITDGDTDAQILTYYGMFDPSPHLNSFGANGDITLAFNVESETYHA